EAGPAPGAHEGNRLAQAGFIQGFDAVPAADDAGGAVFGGGVGNCAGDGVGSFGEAFVFKKAHGPVPKDGFGMGHFVAVSFDGGGSDIEPSRIVGAIHVRIDPDVLVFDDGLAFLVQFIGLDGIGDDIVGGQQKFD